MGELNVTASAYFYTFVVANSVQGPYPRLTVSVSASNGDPMTSLEKQRFKVWGMSHDAGHKLVELMITQVIELVKAQPSSLKGIYEVVVSKQDGSGFDETIPWTFIINVRLSGWFIDLKGQTVVGVNLRTTPNPHWVLPAIPVPNRATQPPSQTRARSAMRHPGQERLENRRKRVLKWREKTPQSTASLAARRSSRGRSVVLCARRLGWCCSGG